ncbi:hypothetical protein D9619_000202 [Psilocybe cf. subviscida]|uniref:Nephrocystin 3-like N-terminal domain-containing protein n=1 Tax=Psilocybe cf. subviscida TaxID=2480587 RepID=A0A8H5BEQ9_9AGAR|nr:hypothetical protein D9619_000202 [Psilocybe cf. subviscida]
MFSDARNIVITGNPTFISHVIDRTSAPTEKSLDKGIKLLLKRVAKGAMHNSGQRFYAPTCHPETRIALQDDVVGWVDEPPGGQLVTWMYGPARAGKSAIVRTISQNLQAKCQLTAFFFFSRKNASKGQGDESALIATLAYQLSLSDPATKPFIARGMRENPLIFDLSLDEQMEVLIVDPLTAAYKDHTCHQRPGVIIVDGLDKCRKDDNTQSRVVCALIKGLSSIPNCRHKLIITSQPEHHIAAIFRDYKPELIRKMEVNDKWSPDDDIRTFLKAAFAIIRRSHSYFDSYFANQKWPSRSAIDTLVARSSGQFIYASVVIKYIKSDDCYDPAARLKVILKLENSEDRPYAGLDALYEHMFSQTRNIEKVLIALSLERMMEESALKVLGHHHVLCAFMGASNKEMKFSFHPLISLLLWEKPRHWSMNCIEYMHASLPDFLADESRSNTFCIYSMSIVAKIVRRALDLLKAEDTMVDENLMRVLPEIPRFYAQKLSSQHKINIYLMISGFNFVENVLSRLRMDRIYPTTHLTIKAQGRYLEWILTESLEGDNSRALVKPLNQIRTWIKECLKGLKTTGQVDLWPFFTASPLLEGCRPAEERRRISDYVLAALEICGSTTFSHQVSQDEWLANTNLLDRYAITEKRYEVALLRASNYIMRLPEAQLAALVYASAGRLSAPMTLARRTFDNCGDTLAQKFFGSLSRDRHRELAMVKPAISYLASLRDKFPFLCDPKSYRYIQAKADAKATWLKTKKHLYDPILSRWAEPDSSRDSYSLPPSCDTPK